MTTTLGEYNTDIQRITDNIQQGYGITYLPCANEKNIELEIDELSQLFYEHVME